MIENCIRIDEDVKQNAEIENDCLDVASFTEENASHPHLPFRFWKGNATSATTPGAVLYQSKAALARCPGFGLQQVTHGNPRLKYVKHS